MNYKPEYIAQIASTIKANLDTSIYNIQDLSERTGVIAINGRIEAARSGTQGVGFRIVANEFSHLNDEIIEISVQMQEKISEEVQRLIGISEGMAKQVRGERLSQIALSIMDVIDRNLYERTCDVRWWATDPSLVDALNTQKTEQEQYASERLGIILDSYTVYLDLFLINARGAIVSNGRENIHKVKGKSCSDAVWFKKALLSSSGDEYSFQSTHASPLVNNEKVLVYSCRVDDRNNNSNEPLGVLGIFFNWKGLVDAVLGRICSLDLKEDLEVHQIPTDIHIIDETGIVLASTSEKGEGEKISLPHLEKILSSRKNDYEIIESSDGFRLIAYGYSPGFETYATGWYCLIDQKISQN
ncbi:MAG: methyl-accepting chemotaxis protein [Spirochaetales bacterium]|nr:methyl-accepting chemotaxis protein [Spirochaetales bacterium]